jgi:Glycosyltransferase family 87
MRRRSWNFWVFLVPFLALLVALSRSNFRLLGYEGILFPLPLLLAFHFRSRLKAWVSPLMLAVVGAVCLATALLVCRNYIYWQMGDPKEFDFLAFWYFGYLGVSGMNFYQLETMRLLPPFWHPSLTSGFQETILNVGYLYAPPSMFWMLPLGWLAIPKAIVYWYGLQIAALAANILLLKRIFLPKEGFTGWVAVVALVACFPPVTHTFFRSQTNFTALLTALLFWQYRTSIGGGVWVGIGMTIKNYFPAFLLFSILRGHIRTLIGFFAASAVLWGLAWLYFGPDICLSYFTERPPTRAPFCDLVEVVNQSLSACFLRLGFQSVVGHPVFTWPFLICGAVMTLATALAIRRAPAADTDWGLALNMVLVLIFYPGAWEHYATLSLPAVFLIWTRRSQFRGGLWLAIFTLVAVFAFTTYFKSLPAHLLLWAMLLLFSPGLPWSTRMRAASPVSA